MDTTDIRTLYAYNRWANQRMFSVLEKLSDEQFNAAVQSSFPSIRESVFHILAAEWIWLKRWQGTSPRAGVANPNASMAVWNTLTPSGPSAEELSTLSGLRKFADVLERERSEFIQTLTEDKLHNRLSFTDMASTSYSEPLAELMQHVVNHGTYHRGQVTTLQRQVGGETVPLDMVYFFRERQEKSAGA